MESFAWPLAVVVCFVVFVLAFKLQIAGFIERLRRVGFGDKSIDLNDSRPAIAAEGQKHDERRPTAIETIPATHALPPAYPALEPLEKEIRDVLAQANLPPDLERTWLIRIIASWRVMHSHEVTFRLIMGSQIALLLEANTPAPPDLERARGLYEQASLTTRRCTPISRSKLGWAGLSAPASFLS